MKQYTFYEWMGATQEEEVLVYFDYSDKRVWMSGYEESICEGLWEANPDYPLYSLWLGMVKL